MQDCSTNDYLCDKSVIAYETSFPDYKIKILFMNIQVTIINLTTSMQWEDGDEKQDLNLKW